MTHNHNKRTFGITVPEKLTIQKDHAERHRQPFRPLPAPTGHAPYHLSLDSVLPEGKWDEIKKAKKLVFHAVGDTGGIQSGTQQTIVAKYMYNDLLQAKVAFFYHLGDVVYYYGEADHYYGEFYDPYFHYDAPIFAIPGNHDGNVAPGDDYQSLAAFKENFCSLVPEFTPEAGDSNRQSMTQPNVYWTLNAPYVTIIGLYTNVPEGGQLDNHQIDWLHSEMKAAPEDKALIIAMHHPIYSLDTHHSGSSYMGEILDDAMKSSKRIPDLVLAAHVHNYQRFTRTYGQKTIPYIVAGTGGYFHLHHQQWLNGQGSSNIQNTDTKLEKWCDNRWGFLRLEVTEAQIRCLYKIVPLPHEEATLNDQDRRQEEAKVFDEFTVNVRKPAPASSI